MAVAKNATRYQRTIKEVIGKEEAMTNWELLERKINESGLRRAFIYEKVGISRSGWNHKKKTKGNFSTTQITALCDVLRIKKLSEKEEIFFAKM